MLRPLRIALPLAALLTAALACDESAPTRVWGPEDHAHPEGRVDPSRMTAPAETEPVGTARERAIAALYQVHCASCHGAGGRGDGPGREPGMQVPDFTSPEWQRSREDAALVQSIAQGRNMMPAFGDRLAEENVRALVGHVRAFAAEPPGEAPPAPSGEAPPAPSAPAPSAPAP